VNIKYRLLTIVLTLFLISGLTGIVWAAGYNDWLKEQIKKLTTAGAAPAKSETADYTVLYRPRTTNASNWDSGKKKTDITELVKIYGGNRRDAVSKPVPGKNGYIWPVTDIDAPVTGSFYEDRGTYRHQGIDIAVPVGTPVKAALGGKFYKADQGKKTGFGKYVYLVHDNGLVTYYGHLDRWAPTEDGAEVPAGKTVGWSGNTGDSSGPHLHFEIRGKSGSFNPLKFIK